MTSRIKNIIFDIGGLILYVDFMPAVMAFAKESGLSPEKITREIFLSEELRQYDLGKISNEDFFGFVRSRFNVRIDEKKMKELWSDIFEENKAVTNLIRAWHGQYRMFLISNTCRSHVEQFESQFDLFRLFEQRIYSCDVGLLKPDVAIFELALDRFGISASQTLFIDDKPENAEGARKAGMTALQFTDMETLMADLKSLGLITG